MAKVTLKSALELIQAERIGDRTQGLSDIKHVFRHNRNKASTEHLRDETYNLIFTELFRLTESEKVAYTRAKAPTPRSAAANRLTAISGALKLSVDAGVPALKLRTVKTVLRHVSQTMRMANGDFCHPIALDYARCFKAILSHQPHVTHLPPDEWEEQLDFAIDCIQTADREQREHQDSPILDRTSVLSYRSSRSVVKDSGNSQDNRSSSRQVAEEMIACVRLLTAPPNVPLIEKSAPLIWTLIECLRSSSNTVPLQHNCFGAVNNLLLRIRTENITLTREITPHLIRLIKNLWPPHKSHALQDELLVTMILIRPYVFDIVGQEQAVTFRSELASLYKMIRAEYCNRPDRDRLNLSHLRFEVSHGVQTGKIATSIFRLRCAGASAEQYWFVLDTLASLGNCLMGEAVDDKSDQESDDGYGEDLNNRPRKRQRTENEFEDMLFQIPSEDGGVINRLCNFQIIAFLAQQRALSSKHLAQVVDSITASMSENLGTAASWAFLALASCASQSAATSPVLGNKWNSVWQLATRALSHPSSCRAASYTLFILLKLRLIPQASSSELVHTITTAMDLNGPTVFTDSVTLLLTAVLHDAAQQSPAASSATADTIVRWWTRTYAPSKYDERVHASSSSAYEVSDVRSLIGACLNKTSSQSLTVPFPVWDSLSSTWLHCENEQELLSYLLLRPVQVTGANSALFNQPRPFSGSSQTACEALVLTHMTSELAQINDRLRGSEGRLDHITNDALSSLCKACCFMTSLAYEASLRDSKRQGQLQRQVEVLLKLLSAFASRPTCRTDEQNIIISVFSTSFSNWRSLEDREFRWPSKAEKSICKTICDFMKSIQEPKDAHEEDIMDIDESNESQDSRRGGSSAAMSNITDNLSVTFSQETLHAGAFCYAHAIIVTTSDACFSGFEDDPHNGEPDDEIEQPSTAMVDWITAQPERTILASRKIIAGLPKLGFILDASDVERLLDFLMERILGSYVYNRSEVAIGTVVDVMSSLLSVWSDPSHRKLFDLGVEIYEWFTNTAIPNGMISPNVQQKLATLLLQLCHVNTDYANGSEAPSVRTTLFGLLKTGSITLQYHLAGKISSLFNLFVLSAHPAMFNDLQSSLPADAEWIEGIAMRLLFLAKLAATWHSLLRQCIYYMFDAAGRVGSSLGHATRCIQELAHLLPVKSPRRLFSLFAPQLLHTWLEGQHISEIPYAAFQYQSLSELFQYNHQEICAQSIMRGSEEALHIISKELKISTKELVRQSFAKCVAYAISRDVCSTSNSSAVETRLRNLVGTKEDFKRLMTQQFAAVLGQFFLCMQQDDLEDTWLEKRNTYSAAYEVLVDIKRFSFSDRRLPDAQEPSFRSKYLCDQVERLCRRISLEPTRPWDTSSFTLAVRMLLDSMDESLGSLHACLMIRRLRVLIAMGGQVALVEFPLEMLILSLRPFINDAVCADDVLGILHYLFDRGQEHLKTKLAFLGGTITMLILQMRKRAKTRQDSTTQESQHQATVQKMIDFQGWLVRYLAALTQGHPSAAYDILINSLKNLMLPGNARSGSPESGLLMFLLDQWFSEERLCTRPDCLEALQLLSEKFELPATEAEDCLAEDHTAIKYAQPLWAILREAPMSQNFTVWAARVLGRAYASTGLRPSEINSAEYARLDDMSNRHYEGTLRSQHKIANRLCELLYSKDRHEAGLAEYTLRKISVSFHNSNEAAVFERLLVPVIEPVVQEGNYGYCPAAAENFLITPLDIKGVRKVLEVPAPVSINEWTTDVAVVICRWASKIPILPALVPIMRNVDGLAQELLPAIIHLLLASEVGKENLLRVELSAAASRHLADLDPAYLPIQQLLLKVILYLQSQPIPEETTKADRLQWLDIDLFTAAEAAARCEMPTCALMLAELNLQPPSPIRRASRNSLSQVQPMTIPDDLLLSIFKQVEEPDSFYGIQQAASLQSVLERLDHEADGFGSLMFRSAQMDSHMRLSQQRTDADVAGLTHSLSTLNLNSLSFALLSQGFASHPSTSADMLTAARTLQQWDVSLPESLPEEDVATFSIFQELSRAMDLNHMWTGLQSAIVKHVRRDQSKSTIGLGKEPPISWFSTLATFTEIGEVISCVDYTEIRSRLSNFQSRQSWMRLADYDHVLPILSSRHTLFGVLSQNQQMQRVMHLSQKQVRTAEVECLLDSSRIAREHSRLQVALAAVSSLNDMMDECKRVDLNVEAAVKFETAFVLWDSSQGEVSVKMLRDILNIGRDKPQDIAVGEPGLLAQLGHQLASARFERPELIMESYLTPAVSKLQDCKEGAEAGKVFFEFASFCDSELFNPVSIEHVNRISKLRQRKADEVSELKSMLKLEKRSDHKKQIQRQLDKAQQWYDIDNAEWQRLKKDRDVYLQQSLRTYLLALRASDDHDICVLRFFALWLENAEETAINKMVSKYLQQVPSWKFVRLMNQLMSRLEDDKTTFQGTLKALIMRLCLDHPYHSMHHLFAAHRKPINTDETAAMSRYTAAHSIAYQLRDDKIRGELLNSLFLADRCYDGLAQAQPELRENSNKIATKDFSKAMKVAQTVPPLKIPPATLSLSLRPDCDYSSAPTVIRCGSTVSVLGGLSAPKLLTIYATDGELYRQIFKSGNDDLRQDAIMEQVFEEVSNMLRNHKATRQRDLKVRTYKVIPLSSNSGIIEFVANSVPLGEFLKPAHYRYYPQDYRDSKARDAIRSVQNQSPDTRLNTFRKICQHMHPVLRHFFFERFHAPDEWFAKRTAYTRTTATVSMLGSVLGLGDRHCQNILLDEHTGEVVHIDLGVAFEAGRVLPIPELVPFRLTRDIVDGMGVTRTEGVFRRCCEFTVDALREDKERIMTLLNVLRYDPLYTWTVSPLRAKRLQDAQDAGRNGDVNAAAAATTAAGDGEKGAGNDNVLVEASSKKKDQEAGEADRALSIVEKKLSTTLSTAATVNELIQQATDERHLAMLFGGWSAYF